MGIKNLLPNLKSITQTKNIRQFKGQKVAIDTYSWLHKGVFSCALELGQGKPTTKWIDYCMRKIELLQFYDIYVVLVFDGSRLPSKNDTEQLREEKRKQNKLKALEYLKQGNTNKANEAFSSSIDITPQMAYELICKVKGRKNIECIVAPYEADSQLTYLSVSKYVDFIISEDSDLIAFGCLRVFYKMDNQGEGQEISFEQLVNCQEQNFSKWNPNMFLTLCILAGCDYLDSLKGIGFKKAYQLVDKYKTYKGVIHSIRREGKIIVPEDYEINFVKAFVTFRYQTIYDPIQKQIANLNPLLIDAMKTAYGAQNTIIEDEEKRAWQEYEQKILEKAMILILANDDNFQLDFLGDLDPELGKRICECEVDPETFKEYLPINKDPLEVQLQKNRQQFGNNIHKHQKVISNPTQKQYFNVSRPKNKIVFPQKNVKKQTSLDLFSFTQSSQNTQSQNTFGLKSTLNNTSTSNINNNKNWNFNKKIPDQNQEKQIYIKQNIQNMKLQPIKSTNSLNSNCSDDIDLGYLDYNPQQNNNNKTENTIQIKQQLQNNQQNDQIEYQDIDIDHELNQIEENQYEEEEQQTVYQNQYQQQQQQQGFSDFINLDSFKNNNIDKQQQKDQQNNSLYQINKNMNFENNNNINPEEQQFQNNQKMEEEQEEAHHKQNKMHEEESEQQQKEQEYPQEQEEIQTKPKDSYSFQQQSLDQLFQNEDSNIKEIQKNVNTFKLNFNKSQPQNQQQNQLQKPSPTPLMKSLDLNDFAFKKDTKYIKKFQPFNKQATNQSLPLNSSYYSNPLPPIQSNNNKNNNLNFKKQFSANDINNGQNQKSTPSILEEFKVDSQSIKVSQGVKKQFKPPSQKSTPINPTKTTNPSEQALKQNKNITFIDIKQIQSQSENMSYEKSYTQEQQKEEEEEEQQLSQEKEIDILELENNRSTQKKQVYEQSSEDEDEDIDYFSRKRKIHKINEKNHQYISQNPKILVTKSQSQQKEENNTNNLDISSQKSNSDELLEDEMNNLNSMQVYGSDVNENSNAFSQNSYQSLQEFSAKKIKQAYHLNNQKILNNHNDYMQEEYNNNDIEDLKYQKEYDFEDEFNNNKEDSINETNIESHMKKKFLNVDSLKSKGSSFLKVPATSVGVGAVSTPRFVGGKTRRQDMMDKKSECDNDDEDNPEDDSFFASPTQKLSEQKNKDKILEKFGGPQNLFNLKQVKMYRRKVNVKGAIHSQYQQQQKGQLQNKVFQNC